MNDQNLFDNNPYRNQSYKKTPWQGFLQSLGFRTQSDAWKENMAVQASEYDAALAQKLRDEEYNDPMNQVSRLRAAGINPDLEGGASVDPGSAANMPEDPSTPMQSTGDEPQLVNFANGVLSCFSTALGLVSSVQGVVRNGMENRLLGLSSDKQISDLALQYAPTFLPPSADDEVSEDGTARSWLSLAFDRMKMFSRGNIPKSYRKKFENAVTTFFNSAPGEAGAYKTWYDNITNQKSYYAGKNQFYSPSPHVMDLIYKHLGSAAEKLEILRMKSQGQEDSASIAENENREDIALGINTETAVLAENAKNKMQVNEGGIHNVLRGTIKDLLDDLDKDPDPFAQYFKVALAVYMFTMSLR